MTDRHIYIAIYEGVCLGGHVDLADSFTALFVATAIRSGGYVERVTFEVGSTAVGKPWPCTPQKPVDTRAIRVVMNNVSPQAFWPSVEWMEEAAGRIVARYGTPPPLQAEGKDAP